MVKEFECSEALDANFRDRGQLDAGNFAVQEAARFQFCHFPNLETALHN